MIEVLLNFGGNPDIQDNIEIGANTPTHLATERNMLDVIEMMLKAHSDVSIKNANGFTCLHIAAKEGLLEMCKRLVEYGKLLSCN